MLIPSISISFPYSNLLKPACGHIIHAIIVHINYVARLTASVKILFIHINITIQRLISQYVVDIKLQSARYTVHYHNLLSHPKCTVHNNSRDYRDKRNHLTLRKLFLEYCHTEYRNIYVTCRLKNRSHRQRHNLICKNA